MYAFRQKEVHVILEHCRRLLLVQSLSGAQRAAVAGDTGMEDDTEADLEVVVIFEYPDRSGETVVHIINKRKR